MPDTVYIHPRIKVFIDYWNFQLLVNEMLGQDKTAIDWRNIGNWLAKEASLVAKIDPYNNEGTNIYTSYNPRKDPNYVNWVQNWLNRQPGIQVHCLERKAKREPDCPTCYQTIYLCPKCGASMIGSEEKGVDALIVTDMISLAWENSYDMAVLASSDRDLIPAVKYLSGKGKKVIHAGFREIGSDLSKSCWASFDVSSRISEFTR
jgi:uncharacterized LabA/DUF88 family protein